MIVQSSIIFTSMVEIMEHNVCECSTSVKFLYEAHREHSEEFPGLYSDKSRPIFQHL